MLAQTVQGEAVATCDLPATVMPRILRGITVIGIDSVMATHTRRDKAWALLAGSLDRQKLASLTQHAPAGACENIVAGKVRRRVVFGATK